MLLASLAIVIENYGFVLYLFAVGCFLRVECAFRKQHHPAYLRKEISAEVLQVVSLISSYYYCERFRINLLYG
jgi:hypothetical protein